jgi:calcineurin-like phosphoesterase family protein
MFQPYSDSKRALPFTFPAWVTADQHWNHARITEFEPVRTTLPADHNEIMLARWRETVAETDTLIHLGDVALGKKADFEEIGPHLPGRKFLMRGNHDRAPTSWYESHGFTLIPEFCLDYGGYRVRFQHRPDYERVYVRYPKTLVVHGHVHSKTLDDRKQINCSVEATDFRPVWITDVLDARIAELEGKSEIGVV